MLWMRCCPPRPREVDERAGIRQAEAALLADGAAGMGAVSADLQLCETISAAVCARARFWLRLRCSQFAFPACRRARDEWYLPRRSPEPDGVALEPATAQHRAEDQLHCPDLSRHSGDHDGAQSLLLRERVLHAVGEQQGRDRYSDPAFQKNPPALDGFL